MGQEREEEQERRKTWEEGKDWGRAPRTFGGVC